MKKKKFDSAFKSPYLEVGLNAKRLFGNPDPMAKPKLIVMGFTKLKRKKKYVARNCPFRGCLRLASGDKRKNPAARGTIGDNAASICSSTPCTSNNGSDPVYASILETRSGISARQ